MMMVVPWLVAPFRVLFCLVALQLTASDDPGRSRATEHIPSPPRDARYCVDISMNEYVCSDDPMETRKQFDQPSDYVPNHDVPQRIDGTEKERQGIRSVLELADAYYYEEVLSNPEYREVRKHCRNTNELCSFWAYIGECKTNRLFMLTACPKACRFCLLFETSSLL